jgi:glycosyltransferase involved in cell wall biosynthesis
MKILQVRSIFPLQPAKWHGGATQAAYHISKELIRRGHQVEVWAANTLDMKTKIDSRLTVVDGIKVSYFPYIMPYSTFFLSPALIKAARSRLEEFDVIHIHNFRTFEGPAVAYYAKKKSVPYIMQAHGSLPVTDNKRNLKQCFDKLCGNKLLRNATEVIALTETEAAQYRAMGVSEDRIKIVPNGIDPSEFENLPERGEFRKKWGIGRDEKVVLYLGRLHKTKGIDLLIEAFSSVCREMKDTWLVVAGPDQGLLAELNSLTTALGIKSKTLFTGPLYERDKLGAYVDADVFVNMRVDEIFGIVFLEALACGTPVICSKECGLVNLIDGQVGLAVPPEQDALGKAIVDLLKDERKSRQLGETGRQVARGRFDWQKIAEQVESVYQEVKNG